jgi:hypothetical protein
VHRELSDPVNRRVGLEGPEAEFPDLLAAARELRNLAAVLKAAGDDTVTIGLLDETAA